MSIWWTKWFLDACLSTEMSIWWTKWFFDACLSTEMPIWWTNWLLDACLSTEMPIWWTKRLCRGGGRWLVVAMSLKMSIFVARLPSGG